MRRHLVCVSVFLCFPAQPTLCSRFIRASLKNVTKLFAISYTLSGRYRIAVAKSHVRAMDVGLLSALALSPSVSALHCSCLRHCRSYLRHSRSCLQRVARHISICVTAFLRSWVVWLYEVYVMCNRVLLFAVVTRFSRLFIKKMNSGIGHRTSSWALSTTRATLTCGGFAGA